MDNIIILIAVSGESQDAAAAAAAAAAGDTCLGLLTLVLLLANSSLMVCGRSGSKRTPCCDVIGDIKRWRKEGEREREIVSELR